MAVLFRQRDRKPREDTPVVEPAIEVDNRVDDVLRRLDSMALRIDEQTDLTELEELSKEIAALREAVELPWEFDIKRAANGRIKSVVAARVRPRLI